MKKLLLITSLLVSTLTFAQEPLKKITGFSTYTSEESVIVDFSIVGGGFWDGMSIKIYENKDKLIEILEKTFTTDDFNPLVGKTYEVSKNKLKIDFESPVTIKTYGKPGKKFRQVALVVSNDIDGQSVWLTKKKFEKLFK